MSSTENRERSRSPVRDAPTDKGYTEDKTESDPVTNGDGNAPNESTSSEPVKIYVGNLSYDTREGDLTNEFGRFGKVTEVVIPTHRDSGRSKGFAFVYMADGSDKAIRDLNEQEFMGRRIRVNISDGGASRNNAGGGFGRPQPATNDSEVRLYVGNLSSEIVESEVREIFEKYGTVTDIFLPLDRQSGRARGFGFVTMTSGALDAMNATNEMDFKGGKLRVNESKPRGERRGGRGGRGGYNDRRGGGYGGYGGRDGGYGGRDGGYGGRDGGYGGRDGGYGGRDGGYGGGGYGGGRDGGYGGHSGGYGGGGRDGGYGGGRDGGYGGGSYGGGRDGGYGQDRGYGGSGGGYGSRDGGYSGGGGGGGYGQY